VNILFLLLKYPDSKSETNLYSDLVYEFKNNGHNVFVITIIEKKYCKKTYLEEVDGIKILRVKVGNYFNVGFVEKGLTIVSLSNILNRARKIFFKDTVFDLCLYSTPPITFNKIVAAVKKECNCKTILILRDIFPQNAVDLGLIKKNILFYYFLNIEKKLYRISDYIGCMSKKNISYISKNNKVKAEKLFLLPNWKKIHDSSLKTTKSIDIRKQFELNNKFIIVFGGVIGIAQELTFILDIAKKIKDRSEIFFLIVGDGNQKPILEEIIIREKLSNVKILDKLPRNEFNNILESCDAGLVCLNRNFTIPNYPSKTLDYFEAKIPILASIDKHTDYFKLLDESGGGLWSYTGDEEGFIKNVLILLNAPELRKKLGEMGYKYLNEHFTEKEAYKNIMANASELNYSTKR